jgi:threonine synthase
MLKSGKTPMIRARKIEAALNINHIYLKLEGANPTGERLDRITERLVKTAVNSNSHQILAHGSRPFLNSLHYFAALDNLSVIIPRFANERWKQTLFSNATILDWRNVEDGIKLKTLQKYASENNMYLALEGETDQLPAEIAVMEIAQEISDRNLEGNTNLYLYPVHNHDLSGMHRFIYQQSLEDNKPSPINVIWATSNHKTSNQIEDHGFVQEMIDDDLIKESAVLLKKEQLSVSKNGAMAFAVFLNKIKYHDLANDNHVILLNSGKSSIKIERVLSFDEVPKRQLIEFTKSWLHPYSDSLPETAEAIQNAMDEGFILLANKEGEHVGICVIVSIGFKTFIPSYHLAYIGVNPQSKGRGIGILLLHKAVELTKGSVSLHVDLGNNKAKRLYEKIGFVHVYNRMIYKEN